LAQPPSRQAITVLEREETSFENRPRRHLLAAIEQDMPITARPGSGRTIGEMSAGSRFFGTPHQAWILNRTKNGRFGKVAVPYSARRATGWIRLGGLEVSRTAYSVRIDLSEHRIVVKRLDQTIMRFPAATGAPGSPTPPGRYFVTDRVPIPQGGSFGTFAFGLSGIQPNLPAGWDGGDQLAIHGTNDPGSIGTSASAGCLRVSERALDRLEPILHLGTPVVIRD
jgi:L,D-transpeptidase catalytic domain